MRFTKFCVCCYAKRKIEKSMNASTSALSNFLNIFAKPHDCKVRAVIKFLNAENVPTAEIYRRIWKWSMGLTSCPFLSQLRGPQSWDRPIPGWPIDPRSWTTASLLEWLMMVVSMKSDFSSSSFRWWLKVSVTVQPPSDYERNMNGGIFLSRNFNS